MNMHAYPFNIGSWVEDWVLFFRAMLLKLSPLALPVSAPCRLSQLRFRLRF